VRALPVVPTAADDGETARRIAARFETMIGEDPSQLWPNNLHLLAQSASRDGDTD
jgi:hypothetical protein